jgi:hypothetical protein
MSVAPSNVISRDSRFCKVFTDLNVLWLRTGSGCERIVVSFVAVSHSSQSKGDVLLFQERR